MWLFTKVLELVFHSNTLYPCFKWLLKCAYFSSSFLHSGNLLLYKQPWRQLLSSIMFTNELYYILFSFFYIKTVSAALVPAFWKPFSSLTLWVGITNWWVHGVSCTIFMAMFCCNFGKIFIWEYFSYSLVAKGLNAYRIKTTLCWLLKSEMNIWSSTTKRHISDKLFTCAHCPFY